MVQHATATSTITAAAPSLNVYKKIPVIRRPSDTLNYEDAEGNQKFVSIQELGDAIASATPLHTPKVKLDIPVPRINVVRNYDRDVPASYNLPLSYIRYHRRSTEEWMTTLEYIADAEDELWLKQKFYFSVLSTSQINSIENDLTKKTYEKDDKGPQLTMDLFEYMFDIMDKATAFDSIISIPQAEVLFQSKIPQLYRIFPSKGRQGIVTSKHVVQEVYNYWVQKRSKLKRPLLRRFWPVTSSDDTNPHMVFRPREKEKYKLRKKRQNDINAYRKMKQLWDDFNNIRLVLDLARHREEMHRIFIKLHIDLFHQRLYDAVNTSQHNRPSKLLKKGDVLKTLETVPTYFDIHLGGRKARRVMSSRPQALASQTSIPPVVDMKDFSSGESTSAIPANVAGRNNGEPAPNFLQPLQTRESYVHSWDGTVPHVPTHDDAHLHPTYRFRHRPRVGRGGRLCIDRVPILSSQQTNFKAETIYTAGYGMPHSLIPKQRLLDLLPKPLDHAVISQRIEALSVAAIKEDFESKTSNALSFTDPEENDGEEVVVDIEEWLDTDDQKWGDERYAIGPI